MFKREKGVLKIHSILKKRIQRIEELDTPNEKSDFSRQAYCI